MFLRESKNSQNLLSVERVTESVWNSTKPLFIWACWDSSSLRQFYLSVGFACMKEGMGLRRDRSRAGGEGTNTNIYSSHMHVVGRLLGWRAAAVPRVQSAGKHYMNARGTLTFSQHIGGDVGPFPDGQSRRLIPCAENRHFAFCNIWKSAMLIWNRWKC